MNSDLSKIGIGTAQFGIDYGIANDEGIVTKKNVNKILDCAKQNKINLIDTAKSYGSSEEVLGKYFSKNSIYSWNIVTKIDNVSTDLEEQLAHSENMLNHNVNTVLAHSHEVYLNKQFLYNIAKLKDLNKIKKFGVSCYTESEIKSIMESSLRPDIIQIPINILDTRLLRSGMLKYLKTESVEIHARSIFLQGLLHTDEKFWYKNFKSAYDVLIYLKSIADQYNLTLADMSLLWVLDLSLIDRAIIGIDNYCQFLSNVELVKKNINVSFTDKVLNHSFDDVNVLNPSLWN